MQHSFLRLCPDDTECNFFGSMFTKTVDQHANSVAQAKGQQQASFFTFKVRVLPFHTPKRTCACLQSFPSSRVRAFLQSNTVDRDKHINQCALVFAQFDLDSLWLLFLAVWTEWVDSFWCWWFAGLIV